MHQPAKALLFDLDNTLVARDEAFEAVLREDFPPGETRDLMRKLDASGLACRDRLFREWENHSGNSVSQETFVDRLVSHLKPIPRLLDSLKKLAEEYDIGVISNGGHRSQWAKLKATGLDEIFPPDRVWISADLGFAKPDPRIFWRACESLGLEPSECLYVGDSEEIDGLGARRAGLHFQEGWAF